LEVKVIVVEFKVQSSKFRVRGGKIINRNDEV